MRLRLLAIVFILVWLVAGHPSASVVAAQNQAPIDVALVLTRPDEQPLNSGTTVCLAAICQVVDEAMHQQTMTMATFHDVLPGSHQLIVTSNGTLLYNDILVVSPTDTGPHVISVDHSLVPDFDRYSALPEEPLPTTTTPQTNNTAFMFLVIGIVLVTGLTTLTVRFLRPSDFFSAS